jgi:hypothetical protein
MDFDYYKQQFLEAKITLNPTLILLNLLFRMKWLLQIYNQYKT